MKTYNYVPVASSAQYVFHRLKTTGQKHFKLSESREADKQGHPREFETEDRKHENGEAETERHIQQDT